MDLGMEKDLLEAAVLKSSIVGLSDLVDLDREKEFLLLKTNSTLPV
jgi:hypothetical protein